MYFSTSAQGFYVGDELDKHVMPGDCLTVTVEQEKKIRIGIIEGNIVTLNNNGKITMSPRVQ